MESVFIIIILIISVVIHEVAHGYMAEWLGDPTARLAGRLTLNPISHLDPVGSVIVPIITAIAGLPFGWAKPVPYNPYNIQNKYGDALVAVAGPASNFALAITGGLLIRLTTVTGFLPLAVIPILTSIVLINVVLGIFNLVPIPPLDGSKILLNLLPYRYRYLGNAVTRYWLIIILFFILVLWRFLTPVIEVVVRLLTGL
jgi:Zn-dependent protease